MITNLRYIEDVIIIARNLEESQNLANRVKTEGEKAGLFLNGMKVWYTETLLKSS